jgi:hypothetical protein
MNAENKGEDILYIEPLILSLDFQDIQKIQDLTKKWIKPEVFPLTVFSCPGYSKFVNSLLRMNNDFVENKYYGVYSNDNELLAFVEWRISQKSIFLNNIYVSADRRSKGLGNLLIEHGKKIAIKNNIEKITLDVFDWNVDAKSWYERLGFVCQDNIYWYVDYCGNREYMGITGSPQIIDLPQAEVVHLEFGFSSFKVRTTIGDYLIGRLNNEYYRITDINALNDDTLLKGLHTIDPNRKLFVISRESNLSIKYPYLTFVTSLTRLELPLRCAEENP